jgi:hypothetical protein
MITKNTGKTSLQSLVHTMYIPNRAYLRHNLYMFHTEDLQGYPCLNHGRMAVVSGRLKPYQDDNPHLF